MPAILNESAVERSTYIIDIVLLDENDQPGAINNGGTWKLTTEYGHVINGREAQPLPAAPTATIVLSGDDLALPAGGGSEKRILTVEATYSSDLGGALPLRDQVTFSVVNLTAVP